MMTSDPTAQPDKRRKDLDPAAHFEIPEGYFEELKFKVFDRIKMEAEDPEDLVPAEEKRPLHVVIRPYLYLAAMFVGMALFFKIIPMISGPETAVPTEQIQALTEKQYIRQVTEEEFNQYLMEETQDEYLLATVFE